MPPSGPRLAAARCEHHELMLGNTQSVATASPWPGRVTDPPPRGPARFPTTVPVPVASFLFHPFAIATYLLPCGPPRFFLLHSPTTPYLPPRIPPAHLPP